MIWRTRKINKDHWHRWFTWFPVIVEQIENGHIITIRCWLRYIERKGTWRTSMRGRIWSYRTTTDVAVLTEDKE